MSNIAAYFMQYYINYKPYTHTHTQTNIYLVTLMNIASEPLTTGMKECILFCHRENVIFVLQKLKVAYKMSIIM